MYVYITTHSYLDYDNKDVHMTKHNYFYRRCMICAFVTNPVKTHVDILKSVDIKFFILDYIGWPRATQGRGLLNEVVVRWEEDM